MSGRSIDRREFLRRAAAGGALALAAAQRALGQETGAAQDAGVPPADAPAKPAAKGLEIRELGTTGRKLPRLGLGCAVLTTIKSDEKAIELVKRAHELGIRYFDTAPIAEGRVERLVGEALKGVPREELWIATKLDERKAEPARRAIAASLARLGTEYVDSVHIKTTKHREAASESDSALGALTEALSKGTVRHLGLTSSKGVAYAKRAHEPYPYTIALVPVNPTDPNRFSFITEFLPFAKEKKIAVVGMQTFVTGKKPGTDAVPKRDCIVYALAQPLVDVIVPRCGSIEVLEEAHAAAAAFVQPPDEWLRDLERRAVESAGTDEDE